MRILIADDDFHTRELLRDLFRSESHEVLLAEDGEQAMLEAKKNPPDIIVLDVMMPGKDGYEVCRELRGNIHTRFIPILFLTGNKEMSKKITGLSLGADDYITKPFDMEELLARVSGILSRSKQALAANPLTHLPGGTLIEEETTKRILTGKPLAFAYVDIDNFKAYNDLYGYQKGDEVIRGTAAILIEAIQKLGNAQDFVGHIGGDDFVLMTDPQKANSLANHIAAQFDSKIPAYYNKEHQQLGYVETPDRHGSPRRFPLMTLSIAIATNQKKPIRHYAELVEIVTELKHYAKTMPSRKGSMTVVDRRTTEEKIRHST